jgi:hypothetical protein
MALTPSSERNLLDHYFASVYNRLEAEALLFNRKLPHAGLVGSENENALGAVLREFLPNPYGIEVNAIVIDRNGKASKQADIVIYDASRQSKFFRKVFPVEIVYAVIEVKTSMGKAEADLALDNLRSLNSLDFRPALTNHWKTRTEKENIHHDPPKGYIFTYRTSTQAFETFARWFSWEFLHEGTPLRDAAPKFPEIRTLTVAALDKGLIRMESSNGHVQLLLAEADIDSERGFDVTAQGFSLRVDPAKALFLFMYRLWDDLQMHHLHPGFDIRSYMSEILGSMREIPQDVVYGVASK